MNGRPVVVLQSGDAFENRMRVLPVAVACRDHGWAPIVLVDDIGAASTFAMHDIACVAFADLPERGEPVRAFEPDDLCVLHLMRCAIARRRMDERDWAAALAGTARLWRMLDALAPAALFAWNGYTGVWANALRLYKADHGLPGGFMERGPIAGGAFVDEDGVNGDASLAFDVARAPGLPAGATLDLPPDMPGALAAAGSAGREKVLFVPLQVHDDSNVLLHSPRMARMRDLVNFTIRLRERLGDDWRAVVRPHPEERPGARLNLPSDPHLTVDAGASLDSHLERSAVCLTINSMVGLQAALAGALTVCFGEGIFCRRNFVVAGQACDFEDVLKQVEKRLAEGWDRAASARDFMTELAERSLFWPGQDQRLAAAKLARFGLTPTATAGPVAPAGRESVRVERPAAAYRKMRSALEALKARPDDVVADFDFDPGERLFVSYRKNREPLTRAHLEARAGDLLGRPVRLSRTHRALGAEGQVLMTHSRRLPKDIDRYDLVLDEFGLPHARVYLEAAGSAETPRACDAA